MRGVQVNKELQSLAARFALSLNGLIDAVMTGSTVSLASQKNMTRCQNRNNKSPAATVASKCFEA